MNWDGKGDRAGGAGDRDASFLERLAEGFEDVALEFGQFVHEQHAVMGEGDFAGGGIDVAAEEPGVGGGVMRCAKGASSDQGLAGFEQAHDAMDLGGFEGFIERERREDGGQAFGEHGLAGARGPDEQDIMRTGGGDFEGAFDRFLAFDFGEVEIVVGAVGEQITKIDAQRVDVGFAFKKRNGLAEVADGDDLEALDGGGFGGVVGGDQDAHFAIGLGAERDGEHAFDGTHSAGQAEFTDHDEVIELIGEELFAGGQNANGDG